MAYNDDSVLARLSSLNESHDSIATAAQWIMFHRRHADRTVQLWMQRLKDSSATRRLSLLYLANEVAQQSRIRHKEDFIDAFSPVIAEATSLAYKGAPAEIQNKLKRVIDVWRDRNIFERPIMIAVDARLNDLDKSRGAAKPGFGGSPFGNSTTSIPADFMPLISAHQTVAKLSPPLKTTISGADQEYEKQIDTSTPQPSAPVYAARLNGLLKTLATAENAVAQCVKARESLVIGLEKLLELNRTVLQDEQAAASRFATRKDDIERKKQEVELGIMRALGPSETNGSPTEGTSMSPHIEPGRPEMEALTPPAMEALTPPTMEALTPPKIEALTPPAINDEPSGGDVSAELDVPLDARLEGASGIEMLSNVASSYQSLPLNSNGSNKRRRVDSGEISNLNGEEDDGIDPDVAAMLKDDAN